MSYESFYAEYQRLFGLFVKHGDPYLEQMAKLSDSVPAEWMERLEAQTFAEGV